MPERSPVRSGLHFVLAALCTAAIALALGAVWMALQIRIASATWWFALPAGLAMGYATRAWATPSRPLAMLFAGAGLWLAAVYMQCLAVGMELSALTGLGYLTTLRTAGLNMLLALARTSWGMPLLAACLAGTLLALAMAGRKSPDARLRRRPAS